MINISKATIGGGCFWCVEAVFKRIEGVTQVYPGYAGGDDSRANYKDVCSGQTGHAEVIQVTFNPTVLLYEDLLKIFFTAHDPTQLNRQGNDTGTQYRSVIFYHDEAQRTIAAALIEQLKKSGYYKAPIVTELSPLTKFNKAEQKHFDYYDQNTNQGYCQAIINPKVKKIVKEFNDRIKPQFKKQNSAQFQKTSQSPNSFQIKTFKQVYHSARLIGNDPKQPNSVVATPKGSANSKSIFNRACQCKKQLQSDTSIGRLLRKASQFQQDEIIETDSSPYNPAPMSMLGSQRSLKNVQSYLSEKKNTYMMRSQAQNYNSKSQIIVYSKVLNQMRFKEDENQLMDFDNKYYRAVRQRRLQKIIKFLIRQSKDNQISLADLIENKQTMYRPFQSQGSYQFLYAVKKGNCPLISKLLGNNPLLVYDFNEKQMTALHLATIRNNQEMISILLKYNSLTMSKDIYGLTPLHHAIQNSNIPLIKVNIYIQQEFLELQCPSDLQYPTYLKITQNPLIHDILRKAKLLDILSRITDNKSLFIFVNQMLLNSESNN